MESIVAKEPIIPSLLEQLKELEEKAQQIREQAKATELEKATAAVEALNALGFRYVLTEPGAQAGTRRAVNHTPSDKACSVCGYKTNPPHNSRSHRAQSNKAPFSDAELKEKGLIKV